MKKQNLFLIVVLLGTISSLQASESFIDTFFNNPAQDITWNQRALEESASDGILCCALAACHVPRHSLNTLFCPGQALMAAKLWNVNPTTCKMKMSDFKKVQCNRCCMFTGAACALGSGALVCSACGCAGVAAAAGTGSKICAAGACITPQIPVEFSFKSPTGRSKDS